ncbi:TPA: multidrug ABC transporter permease [Candidatus Saccharibacteria bacterium]|nr:MAG: ABC-2 type transporter [Candidatus Saccharibacteria bacterium GW2011_GWA2_46_10]HCM51885.1 multidrug ABC transporter permease [Candidatus Saccharibacteria bacterium]
MAEVYILWWRHMKRYLRTRSRIIGAVGQPLLFLLALGYGLGSVYKQAGQGNYLHFLVAGVILQTILFSGVFWGMQILFDKRFGFLKEMMVAPISRLRILLGNALGGATISLFQGALVFIIALAIGFRPDNWALFPLAALIMLILSLALTSFGAGLASMVDDFQGFQAINNFLVFPLFFLSSALYPLTNAPELLRILGTINPLSYGVDALRYSLIGETHFGLAKDMLIIGLTLVVCVWFAVNRFNRLQV